MFEQFSVGDCLDPTPLNGSVSPSQSDEVYPEGITVTFTCEDGYSLDGAESSTCDDQGSWNPQPPVCMESNSILLTLK